jgi:starch synthase (maltosyl-transferring)
MVRLNLKKLGLPEAAKFEVKDLLTGEKYEWSSDNYVRLDSFNNPAHIFQIGKVL